VLARGEGDKRTQRRQRRQRRQGCRGRQKEGVLPLLHLNWSFALRTQTSARGRLRLDSPPPVSCSPRSCRSWQDLHNLQINLNLNLRRNQWNQRPNLLSPTFPRQTSHTAQPHSGRIDCGDRRSKQEKCNSIVVRIRGSIVRKGRDKVLRCGRSCTPNFFDVCTTPTHLNISPIFWRLYWTCMYR
jgi:hypothetical protein